ncbi:Sequence-specific DNA binding transcription factors isoform 2 [Tripterygium wilfordii]|uniref:Sequence-specific DNA binding transcription factors isoform 2 n=1 Tax=Tripterygium wilfordii TaxID=458696 RepID=A0A7J7CNF8_TRIWF|nr:trihelix transcription factor ASIL1-like [Tripterygium wilfordii]KAF5735446.1 Sequence-specific DNA binding transcription factors isoform 2 [Tripterygium wilfordii]
MGDITDSLTQSSGPLNLVTTAFSHNPRPMPVREDCWGEEATSTLVDAWGSRYLELNRGNLRQKDWQNVANAVNALHGQTKKTHRTDVQCKNRVDTIKKKYKIEKGRVSASNGTVTSSWPFYNRMDVVIGSSVSVQKQPSPSLSPSPPVALPLTYRKSPASDPPTAVALPQKRPADDGYFRRNYSAMAAAAAAAAESDESEEEEERESEREREEESEEKGEGMRKLVRAIERFGEVYERVEGEKLRQMMELEKQRMHFAKDLEVQRMTMFMDTQVQLEKIKRSKLSGSDDKYS